MYICKYCNTKVEDIDINIKYIVGEGDIYYCDECLGDFNDEYRYCGECGDYYDKGDFRGGETTDLCWDCFDSCFLTCDRCEEEVRKGDEICFNGLEFCEFCFDCIIDEYSLEKLTEMLIDEEIREPFPKEFLEGWLAMLKEGDWGCPCDSLPGMRKCQLIPEEDFEDCGRCGRSTLFIQITERIRGEYKDFERKIRKMFIDCLEGLIG